MEEYKVGFLYKSGSGTYFQFQAINHEEAVRTSITLTKFLIQRENSELRYIELIKVIPIEEIFL